MKVLVTGGAGDIGRVTARWLVQRGWDVRVLDSAPSVDLPDVEYLSGDITHYDTVRDAVRGCQAIVHLAALRNPYTRPAQDVFEINASGTFKVYEAAASEGIGRIAQASSINAIGCAWNIGDIAPQYFPLDEDHPGATTDPYSFSKQIVEDIGAYYWRRDGISSVSLRFPWVHPEDLIESEPFQQRRRAASQVIADFASEPAVEQKTRLERVRQTVLEFRTARLMETPPPRDTRFSDDPLWPIYNSDRFNYWTFVDVRDAAQSLEKGITADYEGHHALFINDPYNWVGYDTRELIRLFYPEVKQFKARLAGTEALVSIARAKSLIGFEPAYSVGNSEGKLT